AYAWLASAGRGDKKFASNLLEKHGVPGIKYLDEGSRAAGMQKFTVRWTPNDAGAEVVDRATGQSQGVFPTFAEADNWVNKNAAPPTHNFVVFHHDTLGNVTRN